MSARLVEDHYTDGGSALLGNCNQLTPQAAICQRKCSEGRQKVLESLVGKIPGSFIEEKDYSLVWHYRRSEPESADAAAKDLVFQLLTLAGEHPVRIIPGSRSIEVRSIGVGKGSFVKTFCDTSNCDFILAAGDDVTDEDLFAALPSSAVTLKVGSGFSKARYRVKDVATVRFLLTEVKGKSLELRVATHH